MGAEERLITGFKEELEKSSIGSNLASLFLLVALEKILEVEFACPCDPKWNKIFVLLFFLIPAVASSLLVLWIRGFSRLEAISNIIATVLLWMALTLLNGQFLVCAFSDWPGTFVTADKTYLNWCKPANTTIYSTEELLKYSHMLYIWSQVRSMIVCLEKCQKLRCNMKPPDSDFLCDSVNEHSVVLCLIELCLSDCPF